MKQVLIEDVEDCFKEFIEKVTAIESLTRIFDLKIMLKFCLNFVQSFD